MTDHKFTDGEIIKALEHCRNGNRGSKCSKCEYVTGCKTWLIGLALDLINRQKAEIEGLYKEIGRISKMTVETNVKEMTGEKKHFTPVEVRQMSPKEVRENYQAIMDSMKEWK